MSADLGGHFCKLHRDIRIGEQSVCAEFLDSWPGGDIIDIGLPSCYLVGIFFEGAGDKFRSVSARSGFGIILTLKHIGTVGEVAQDLSDQRFLIIGGRFPFP